MIRIGHAYDIHRLEDNLDLYLGGVKVDYKKGLLGHSDADVVYHAVAESLLGSLALGDLGVYFPDTDPKYKGINSEKILSFCYNKVLEAHYSVSNLDLTIYAQNVKISKIRDNIRVNIAKIMNLDISQVSVKATTFERLDSIGSDNAIACECVVLVVKDKKEKILL